MAWMSNLRLIILFSSAAQASVMSQSCQQWFGSEISVLKLLWSLCSCIHGYNDIKNRNYSISSISDDTLLYVCSSWFRPQPPCSRATGVLCSSTTRQQRAQQWLWRLATLWTWGCIAPTAWTRPPRECLFAFIFFVMSHVMCHERDIVIFI